MRSIPLGLRAYGAATRLLTPALPAILAWRSAQGKEDPARLKERWGFASLPRLPGDLVWLHGASIGETALAWEAWRCLAPLYPGAHVLFTSGTQTAARWLSARAPHVLHQYLPIDSPPAVRRFMAHWHPQLTVFFESEIWPNLLQEAKRSGSVLALLNARMSPRSLAGWAKWPASARAVFGAFDLIQTAEAAMVPALTAFGARLSPSVGNLKTSALAPPCDEAALIALRAAIGARPVWIAASTHPGEEEIILAAHAALLRTHPTALCIIVPRHPERGANVSLLAGDAPRGALGASINGPIYIADTVGELGLFYRACRVALIGGALTPTGRGHNPFEALALGCATLTGPYFSSFQDVMDSLISAGAVASVRSASELAAAVDTLWSDPAKSQDMARAAQAALAGADRLWQSVLEELIARTNAVRSHAPS